MVMSTTMGADVDIEEFRLLLEDKVNPIQKDIARLEKNSLDILEILKVQVRQDEIIQSIQRDAANNVVVHDEIFKRLREINTAQSEGKLIEARVCILEEEGKSGKDKIWRIVELLIAGFIGALINWGWVKK